MFIPLSAVLLLSLLRLSQAQYLPPPPPSANGQAAPIITKQFYTVSAPEDQLEAQPRTKHLIIGQPRRNYRVIFIRAPSADNAHLRYTAELAPQEDRTVIYVLTKKHKELSAEDIVAPQQQQQQQKPDIFFIKYKTNEEAAAAQHEIQTQYDELGGNSEHAAPIVAPVQSVVGALDAPPAPAPAAGVPSGFTAAAAAAGYDYQRPAPPPLAALSSISSLLPPVRFH